MKVCYAIGWTFFAELSISHILSNTSRKTASDFPFYRMFHSIKNSSSLSVKNCTSVCNLKGKCSQHQNAFKIRSFLVYTSSDAGFCTPTPRQSQRLPWITATCKTGRVEDGDSSRWQFNHFENPYLTAMKRSSIDSWDTQN